MISVGFTSCKSNLFHWELPRANHFLVCTFFQRSLMMIKNVSVPLHRFSVIVLHPEHSFKLLAMNNSSNPSPSSVHAFIILLTSSTIILHTKTTQRTRNVFGKHIHQSSHHHNSIGSFSLILSAIYIIHRTPQGKPWRLLTYEPN